jgi:hypothetical protein
MQTTFYLLLCRKRIQRINMDFGFRLLGHNYKIYIQSESVALRFGFGIKR